MDVVADADVRFARVTKRFGRAIALRDLTLAIPRGAFFSLLGPSGCGKTTTLRLVAGFEQPDEGEVYIRAERVTRVSTAACGGVWGMGDLRMVAGDLRVRNLRHRNQRSSS